ncbi:MAG: glycosyltransferase [Fibrobacteraceae bacterium]|nr:glycosyltransferase [Fibrobacteraceae bacterium]
MIRVLFDLFQAQPTMDSKFHGGGEYIKTVYRCFIENYLNQCSLIVFYDPSKFLDDWILKSFENKTILVKSISSINEIQNILDEESVDVFYSGLPYDYVTLNIPSSIIYCGTIHGLRGVELPCDRFTYKYFEGRSLFKYWIKFKMKRVFKQRSLEFYRKSIDRLDFVICVSYHTKYAIRSFYPHLNKKIEVFYTPEKFIESKKITQSREFQNKYILLISSNRWEKNSFRAVTALDTLFNKGTLKEYKVVTIGKLPDKVWKPICNKDRFICFDYVTSERLENLYAYCDIFLYPTLNEGFGMPPLEAMKYGKTCIVSGVCSLPEVCGDAVYYCNPYDLDEIQNRVLMASEKKISEDIIKKQLLKINCRQQEDLQRLCLAILHCHENRN